MRGDKKTWGRCRHHGQNCGVCEEIRLGTATREQEKREVLRDIQEQLQEAKPLLLCKCSYPGWTAVVDSEYTAKERMYHYHICKTCLQELAYEIDTGERHPEYETEVNDKGEVITHFDHRVVGIHEITLNDLLGTPCGLEYWFGEDDGH